MYPRVMDSMIRATEGQTMSETTINSDRLIRTIPQAGGGTRYVYAQDSRRGRIARRILRDDPAMIDGIDGIEGIEITVRDEG